MQTDRKSHFGSFLLTISLLSAFSGCIYASGALSDSEDANRTTEVLPTPALSIDAGVIFSEEANYICIPFDRLGILDTENIVSISTSCECTRPAVVLIDKSTNEKGRALRVDFEAQAPAAEVFPMNLGIEIAIELDKSTKKVSLKFLYSHRYALLHPVVEP